MASPLLSLNDMRSSGLAVLLLCLLPGLAQEMRLGVDGHSGTESPAAPTVSPFVTSVDLRNSSSNMSDFSSVAPSEGENETIAVTDPPAAEASPVVTVTESGTGTPDITEASQEPTTDSGGNSTSPTAVIPEIPEATGPDLTQPPPTISVTQDGTTGPLGTLTESPRPPRTFLPPDSQTRLTTEAPVDATTTTSTNLTSWTSAITTTPLTTTSVTTVLPSNPARPHTTGAQVQREPPLLELNHNKETPSFHTASSSNPIFVMIVSVFTIAVVMVVVVVGFRRYKKRIRRTEFRRLQDLPMDDMMEDTPLSLYSYQ